MEAGTAEQAHAGPIDGYGADDEPLAGRITLMGTFAASVAAATLVARAGGRSAPERPHPADVVMTGVATHKLSRLLTKAKVTSVVRAPFTELEGPAGKGEVNERPRGRGLQRAIGELLVCPYCVGQWISAGFAAGLVISPRATRLVAAAYSAQAIADFLQLAYLAGEQRTGGPSP